MQRGAQLAVDQINARGGVRGRSLKLRLADDSASEYAAVRVAQTLYDNPAVVAPRIDLLMARAELGECALTVKGVIDGHERGWYLDTDVHPAHFVGDRAVDADVADADLRALAAIPGQALTYTCVPLGSGRHRRRPRPRRSPRRR